MVYDQVRAAVVRFTENEQTGKIEPWSWNGSTWTQIDSVGPQFTSHAVAYDSWRDVTVAVGINPSGIMETWEWNGETWGLVSDSTQEGPKPCPSDALVFDSVQGKMILWRFPSLWVWDGKQWLADGTNTLDYCFSSSLSFDSERGVFVGADFEYDPVQDPDHLRLVATPFRSPNTNWWGASVQYDSATRETIVYGGYSETKIEFFPFPVPCGFSLAVRQPESSTWGRDSNDNWRLLSTDCPGPRQNHDMVLDESRNVIVLYGGSDAGPKHYEWLFLCGYDSPIVGEGEWRADSCRTERRSGLSQNTWEWDGEQWTLAQRGNGALIAEPGSTDKSALHRAQALRSGEAGEHSWVEKRINEAIVECAEEGTEPARFERCVTEAVGRLNDDPLFRRLLQRP